jgi:hypothetical protein
MMDRSDIPQHEALTLVPHSESKLRSLYLIIILLAVIFGGMLANL